METAPEEKRQSQRESPGTPPRPPYSPVTPVFAQPVLLDTGEPKIIPPPLSPIQSTQDVPSIPAYRPPPPPANPPVFKPEPPPVPISESENPDAIALRSAISILQMQKQQSLRDIKALERLKEAASANPEAFAHDLAEGRMRPEDHGAVIQFSDDGDMDIDADTDDTKMKDDGTSSFGRLPQPQNIVRMPPINWAKYNVVGEPLDRMHEEQLRRPSSGAPGREPAPEHVLASPYRPLVDKIETPSRLARPTKTKK